MNNDILVADYGNNRIRKISNGVVSTIVGSGVAGTSGGGLLTAQLNGPRYLSLDSINGILYVADTDTIRMVTGLYPNIININNSYVNILPIACPVGTYSSAGATACTTDPVNTYSGSGAGTYTLTPPGNYSGLGAGTYNTIPAGYYGSGTVTGSSPCPAGYACPGGTTAIQLCPAGRYSPLGATTCSICPGGTYSSAGAAACIIDPVNTYSGSGAGTYTLTPTGNYSGSGAGTYTAIPGGYYGSGVGSGSSQCPAGYSCPGGTVTQLCPAGKYSPLGATTCSFCPAGTYSSAGAAACSTDPENTYSGSGAGTYTLTPSGNYSGSGAGTYTAIPGGYYGSGAGSGSSPCPAGYACPGGTVKQICPTGTYSPAGATTCSPCPAGTYGSTTGLTTAACSGLCSAGSYCSPGTTSNTGSPCPAGYYCPAGTAPPLAAIVPGISTVVSLSGAPSSVMINGADLYYSTQYTIGKISNVYSIYTGNASSSVIPITNGGSGSTDGPLGTVSFAFIYSLKRQSNTLYLSDGYNGIRTSDMNGNVATYLSSSQVGYTDDLVFDSNGNMYILDYLNYCIRKITTAKVVTIIAGGSQGKVDGTGTAAKFWNLQGIAIDSNGNLYVTDNACVRKITPAGIVTTIAGSLTATGSADGPALTATFASGIGALLVDMNNDILVADYGNNKIRKISNGVVSTVAGSGVAGSSNGGLLTGQLNGPQYLALDPLNGILYVADQGSNSIRMIKGLYPNLNTGGSGIGSPPAACPAGTFNGSTGQASCVNCPAGTFSTATAGSSVSVCSTCPAGKTSMPGSKVCI
jgi:hypothetical protein